MSGEQRNAEIRARLETKVYGWWEYDLAFLLEQVAAWQQATAAALATVEALRAENALLRRRAEVAESKVERMRVWPSEVE